MARTPCSTTALGIRTSTSSSSAQSGRRRGRLYPRGGGDDCLDDVVEALAASRAEELEGEFADFFCPAEALEGGEEGVVEVFEGGG
ncbi:hypothetical protein CNMCM5793_006843 [Aspergillus hiratsukae]|uniref:Uncharacterized protein n=1 Tax=Aspergillus hiratsukae TaxID=1194566 RepID=A0A8H6QHM1_9EURO|nr:hypothetical protein CNMCM5793_006843 [Aspergillus hiratsukae]KAF7173790.1 hypothetical protein CNMCM6106_007888 [Aspergillus hiratsukae]